MFKILIFSLSFPFPQIYLMSMRNTQSITYYYFLSMTTDYEKTLRDLQEHEKIIISRLQELDKRKQILKQVHEKLKTRCFNQLFKRAS
jgi:hypothetical protein